MVTIYDVPPTELIEKTAEKLKSMPEIKPKPWAGFVKTGTSRERVPARKDWWYIRAAAVLRSVYRLGPVGVSKLRTKYGGKKNRGHAPEHHFKGSGAVLRSVMQQLESAGLVKKQEKGIHKGRIISPQGKKLLDGVAKELSTRTS
jgi:small subunit ribosomal protein S19e